MTADVSIQQADFDARDLQRQLEGEDAVAGAVACFVGLVRASNEGREITVMELEHYPGMTERSIQQIVDEARDRWAVIAAKVVHRVGRLRPGDQIVYVGVSSAHRGDAFAACEFIMDYLKTRAPFWKKESGAEGEYWVDARASDAAAAERWSASPK
jgi:molybdopterin synthase catalytic subunit